MGGALLPTPTPRADHSAISPFEIPYAQRVPAQNQLPLISRDPFELVSHDLLGVGPTRHRMGEIGGPEDVANTQQVPRSLESQVLVDERKKDVAVKVVTR